MVARRGFLKGLGATALIGLPIATQNAHAITASYAYGINAESEGLHPGSSEDQGQKLQAILKKAAQSNTPVFIPPGRYVVSNVTLPKNTRLTGVNGATLLQYKGGSHFLWAEKAEHLEISNLVLDGGLMPYQDYAGAVLRILDAKKAIVENCHITNASLSGIQIDRSKGRIKNNKIDTAIGTAGIFAVENQGLLICENIIEECANAGVLVHRYTRGKDNTIISNNRIQRISAIDGGTGQYGNGINTANADGVIISGNHVSDCAYSTIRAFSCANIQITNNTCMNAGETSIYSEFEHLGAVISNNIVDKAVTGISMANLDKGGRLSVCSNNLIRNIGGRPPYEDNQHAFGNGISAEADVAITGNVIENTDGYGLSLGWGEYLRNITANANVIRKTPIGIAVSVVKGSGPAAISNNSFSEILRGGIVGYRWKDAVTGDLARTGVGKYTHLTIANNSLNY